MKDITYKRISWLPAGKYFIGDISHILSKNVSETFLDLYNMATLLFPADTFKITFIEDGETKIIHGFFDYGKIHGEEYSNNKNISFKNKKGNIYVPFGCTEIVNNKSFKIAEKMSKKNKGYIISSDIDFIPRYSEKEDSFYILDDVISLKNLDLVKIIKAPNWCFLFDFKI